MALGTHHGLSSQTKELNFVKLSPYCQQPITCRGQETTFQWPKVVILGVYNNDLKRLFNSCKFLPNFHIAGTKSTEFYRFATKQPHSFPLSDSLYYSRSFRLTPAHSDSLWLSRALSGTHRLTRSLLSSLCRSCVALVYPALVGAVFIGTEGALRLPKTSDNHPSNQPKKMTSQPILTTF